MAYRVFEKETLLDISVNIIPILIMLVFVGVLLFTEPWPFDLATELISLGLHVIPIVSLSLLTYIAAKYIG
jgi:hypothetical protein